VRTARPKLTPSRLPTVPGRFPLGVVVRLELKIGNDGDLRLTITGLAPAWHARARRCGRWGSTQASRL
jgi:hypothetical protein